MTAAVRNYVAVPFFERVPPRVMDLVITTFDNIVERAMPKRDAYHFFATSVKQRHFEGPTFDEFSDWHERVKNGLIDRPHPSDVLVFTPSPHQSLLKTAEERGVKQPHAVACVVDLEAVDTERLRQARAIVIAAHALNEAKLAAGYSPASIPLDDTILQQALTDLLAAEADSTVMDADTHMTTGNRLVDLLLGEDDSDIDDKLVGCLTMDMQPELCRILARSDAAKSR
ncbi:hypothetical protein N5C66_05995 [Rhizobium pusense]|uniref:hypothetical protein n=1 Tax=Agrobacterium pusense TaxID=648995 RepID=UPI00244C2C5E|nr:hypothetical protein [Agrobacterium pusense]MDH1097449.1 hypothetical protein [Agrobacterium pusense]MDH1111279.1 hypothetical protein [Agrobacterium pusense]MDH2193482.1 hypothetical protein [Agrobacterium pusense]